MKTKITFLFNKVTLSLETPPIKLENELLSFRYSDEKGFGFTSVNLNDYCLECVALIRIPSYIQSYNTVDKVLEKTVIYIYEEIKFYWDLENSIIYSNASISKFNKIKTILSQCFPCLLSFSNVDFLNTNLINKIKSISCKASVTDLNIKRFIFQEDVIGKFNAHTDNPILGEQLLKEYIGNISKTTIQIYGIRNYKDLEVKLGIHQKNLLQIETEDSYVYEIINFLKILI